jgi:uncharacterized protein (TIGR02145 family)
MNPNFLPSGYLLHQRYSIQQSLGQGGFGITYLAYDTMLDQEVCVKELFIAGNSTRGAEMTVNSQTFQGFSFEDFVNRFIDEARKLAQFRHPNIVRVIDVFHSNSTAYMVMDFVKGETLKQKVQREGALNELYAMNFIEQLLNGVEEVHKKGMLHRDIKPENILLTPEGQVVLIDFGSAREFSNGMTTTNTAMLTPGYAPIEQYSSRAQLGSYTDIYSLGGTLYFLLTGEKPLEATDRSFEDLNPPIIINPNLSSQVSNAVMQAMELKPGKRFQRIAEMREALKSLQGDSGKKIGEQPVSIIKMEPKKVVWMDQNLNVEKFRNGDLIPEAKTEEEWLSAGEKEKSAWCYYNNDPGNGQKYGKLYNWYAVKDPRGLAPEGWHLPSNKEWEEQVDFLGGEKVAGTKMKSNSGWKENSNGTNESGFSGLPGGNRSNNGGFIYIGFYGEWWSSSEFNTGYAWSLGVGYIHGIVSRYYDGKDRGLSVRCIRD